MVSVPAPDPAPSSPDGKDGLLLNLEPFAKLPLAVLRCHELSMGARVAYAALRNYARENGKCFPEEKTLGADLGVGERQVRKYITELERIGLVVVARRGQGKANLYTLASTPVVVDRNDTSSQGRVDRNDTSGEKGFDRNNSSAEKCVERNDTSGLERNDTSGPIKEEVDTMNRQTVSNDTGKATKGTGEEPKSAPYRVFLALCAALGETPDEGEPRKGRSCKEAARAIQALSKSCADPEGDLCATLAWLAKKLDREGKLNMLTVSFAARSVARWRKETGGHAPMQAPPPKPAEPLSAASLLFETRWRVREMEVLNQPWLDDLFARGKDALGYPKDSDESRWAWQQPFVQEAWATLQAKLARS